MFAKNMKQIYHGLIWYFLFMMFSCKAQVNKPERQGPTSDQKSSMHRGQVGGPCDGCELMYIGMPKELNAIDTSAGWWEPGTRLVIKGKVLKRDGKTPAKDGIIYYWQTDYRGYYSPRDGMNKQAKRHGHIRGWIKTDTDGHYEIYTSRPAPYPNRDIPAHIHTSIKEPGINEYYIDEFIFDDDKLLTTAKRRALENRGGSGILRTETLNGIQYAEHNVILGLRVPDYKTATETETGTGTGTVREDSVAVAVSVPAVPVPVSALDIGFDQPSFTPFHAYGPDKGSKACPVCKYGRGLGVLYFVGNHPDWNDIRKWLSFFEKKSVERGKGFKVYFIYGNSNGYSFASRNDELNKIGEELELHHLALTFVPSFSDQQSDVYLSKTNQDVGNTFIVFRNSNIRAKAVNLKAGKDGFEEMEEMMK